MEAYEHPAVFVVSELIARDETKSLTVLEKTNGILATTHPHLYQFTRYRDTETDHWQPCDFEKGLLLLWSFVLRISFGWPSWQIILR
jgi:hypothetical protein